jgi:hypothetical protein
MALVRNMASLPVFIFQYLRHKIVKAFRTFFIQNIGHSRDNGIVVFSMLNAAVAHALTEIIQLVIHIESLIDPAVDVNGSVIMPEVI